MSAPGYRDDPVGYLTQIARRPPSHDCLTRLAGSVAAGIKDAAPSVAGAYLAAAAVHVSVESSSATARSLAAVAAADATSSSVVLERQTTKEVFEIVEVHQVAERILSLSCSIPHSLLLTHRLSVTLSHAVTVPPLRLRAFSRPWPVWDRLLARALNPPLVCTFPSCIILK